MADSGPGALWPPVGTSVPGQLPRGGFSNYMFFNNSPTWQSLIGLQSLFDHFHNNPVFYAVVMIKAREYSNMRIKVVNRWDETKVEPETTRKEIPAKLYALFNKPNILQSRWEFFQQRKIFEEVSGNSMTYGNFALGMKPGIGNLSALWNVWPQYMKIKLAGKYFEATQLSDIIKGWQFQAGAYQKDWEAFEVMHKNKPNTNISDGLIFGRSTASSLYRPLSNIMMAYESRNVLMKNRGMRVVLSSNKSDASGNIALQDDEIKAVDDAMTNYGMLEHQHQFFFSSMPLTATPIDQDVYKLGLFDELATDAMMVCNAYGVPDILLKLYLKGATFENQEASVRRLYQGTLIPEAEDDMIAFNSYLGLDDTDWKLTADFSHVACLQESENQKVGTKKIESDILLNELSKNIIDVDEYRAAMGYAPKPKPVDDPNAPPKTGADSKTLEAQASLRGSVGGVQGILAIQQGVVAGTTTYESAISMLTIIYGFSAEDASNLLGKPKDNGNQAAA